MSKLDSHIKLKSFCVTLINDSVITVVIDFYLYFSEGTPTVELQMVPIVLLPLVILWDLICFELSYLLF